MSSVGKLFNPKKTGPSSDQVQAQEQAKRKALQEQEELNERRSASGGGRPGRKGRSLLDFAPAKTEKKTLGV